MIKQCSKVNFSGMFISFLVRLVQSTSLVKLPPSFANTSQTSNALNFQFSSYLVFLVFQAFFTSLVFLVFLVFLDPLVFSVFLVFLVILVIQVFKVLYFSSLPSFPCLLIFYSYGLFVFQSCSRLVSVVFSLSNSPTPPTLSSNILAILVFLSSCVLVFQSSSIPTQPCQFSQTTQSFQSFKSSWISSLLDFQCVWLIVIHSSSPPDLNLLVFLVFLAVLVFLVSLVIIVFLFILVFLVFLVFQVHLFTLVFQVFLVFLVFQVFQSLSILVF